MADNAGTANPQEPRSPASRDARAGNPPATPPWRSFAVEAHAGRKIAGWPLGRFDIGAEGCGCGSVSPGSSPGQPTRTRSPCLGSQDRSRRLVHQVRRLRPAPGGRARPSASPRPAHHQGTAPMRVHGHRPEDRPASRPLAQALACGRDICAGLYRGVTDQLLRRLRSTAGVPARDIARVWGLWAPGYRSSHGLQPGCELLAELTAAGPGSPVGAGTKGIQHLPDSHMPPRSSQVTTMTSP